MKNIYQLLSDVSSYNTERFNPICREEYNYISTENMLENKNGVSFNLYYPVSGTVRSFIKNDILISNIRPYFKKIWFADRVGGCSDDILVIRANNIYPKFLYYVLCDNNFFNYSTVTAKGTKMPRGSKDAIMKYLVPDVPIHIQEKIADILSTYDDLIENNNRRIEILEQMAQEIYKEWFVRFRFPGHEKVKFKSIKMKNWIIGDKTIFMIPHSWNIGNINELAIFQRGSNLTSANMTNGNIPVISAGIQPSGYHNNANVFGQSITVSASGANAGYLLYHLNDIWASDCSYLQSEYIWFIYNTLKFLQPVLSNLQCGAAQPHVYPKQINKIAIIISTNEILKQYCSKVEPIYEYIKDLKEKNQNLIKQRDLLLPRLMSGKLEV